MIRNKRIVMTIVFILNYTNFQLSCGKLSQITRCNRIWLFQSSETIGTDPKKNLVFGRSE
jgi:hypothetical protein